MLGWMGSYLFSEYDEHVDYIDPDSPEQTIKYVFLEKMKQLEESIARQTSKIYRLEDRNDNLSKELNRSKQSISHLHRMIEDLEERFEILEKKLSKSIILEPLDY